MVTFTWEGVPCARLDVTEDEGFFFLEEEAYDPDYGWLHASTTRFNTLDEAELAYEDRCNWFDAVGCFELINPALA